MKDRKARKALISRSFRASFFAASCLSRHLVAEVSLEDAYLEKGTGGLFSTQTKIDYAASLPTPAAPPSAVDCADVASRLPVNSSSTLSCSHASALQYSPTAST